LLSAAAIAIVAAAATADPVLTSTPSLDNPGIIALSLSSSLASQSLIFDYNAPASMWSLSSFLSDVALVVIHPQLALFVCTGWLLHLILSCILSCSVPLPSLGPLKVLPPLTKPLPLPFICHSFVWDASPLVMPLPLDVPNASHCPG
jgi:hypothetical protein